MKRYVAFLFMLVLTSVFVSPAKAILVDEENTTASLQLAAKLPYMCCAASWDTEGGTRYGQGSATLICNNGKDGAWVLTAKHAVYCESTGEAYNYIRYTFEPSYYDGFPKGTTSYLPEKTIAAIHDKVFFHSTQDIALVKLEHLVYDTSGTLVTPIKFYSGELCVDQTILIGGSGQTGIPSQGGSAGTGYRDGYKRCARGIFKFFSITTSSRAVMEFNRSVSIPGMASNGDSGGFAAIENAGDILMVGVIATVSGSGESALTGFEYLGYNADFSAWMNNIIVTNRTTCPADPVWRLYE